MKTIAINTFRKIISIVVIFLGIVHIGFACPARDLDLYTLWFVGAGIAIVLAGFINVITLNQAYNLPAKVITAVTNTAMFILFIIACSILREPQVYLGIILFLILTLFSIYDLWKKNRPVNIQ